MAITSVAQPAARRITVGVDTHLDLHVAHANDQLGRRVDTIGVPTTPGGYQHLLAWARGLGEVEAWGVEGLAPMAPRWLASCTQQAKSSSRSTAPIAKPAAATARPTRWTPRPPPGRCRPARSPSPPRPAAARWR
jgi:hypothetical protein